MGQYYKFIILGEQKHNNKEIIILVINPHQYGNGAKLMEHSYINNNMMNTVEYLIGPEGQFHKSRVVWAGDYAEEEPGEEYNLNRLTDDYSSYRQENVNHNYKYIVNHTKKLYVDYKPTDIKEDSYTNNYRIHPLPLLISEGNGSGGGDYDGNNYHLIGSWARDTISMEHDVPEGYEELVCGFTEY